MKQGTNIKTAKIGIGERNPKLKGLERVKAHITAQMDSGNDYIIVLTRDLLLWPDDIETMIREHGGYHLLKKPSVLPKALGGGIYRTLAYSANWITVHPDLRSKVKT